MSNQSMHAVAVLGVCGVAAALAAVAGMAPSSPTAQVEALEADRARAMAEASQLAALDLEPQRSVAYCWDADNPPDPRLAAELYDLMIGGELPPDPRYNLVSSGSMWTPYNSPATLSWSFVPDGLFVEGDTSEVFSRMDFLFGGNRALWISKFQQSFDRWEELTGNTYIRVTSGGNDWDDGAGWGASGNDTTRGDVRIAMISIDGSSGTLAFNFFPSSGGDMVLDRQESWNSSAGDYRFLRNVVMHEHGHGLGMFHVCPIQSNKLMEPFLNTNFDGPQHDDVRAGQRGYGDPYENNNSVGLATDLGSLSIGQTLNPSLADSTAFRLTSIGITGESDYFAITPDEAMLLNVSLAPMGFQYDSSTQAGNGSCNSGNFINSLEQADLRFQVIDSDGFTVLADVDDNGTGSSELGTDIPLLDPGSTYYVRVLSGVALGSQLYTLNITGAGVPECGIDSDCDDGDPCNGIEQCIGGECMPGVIVDCNNNGIDDSCDVAMGGASEDCNENGVPDECDLVGETVSADSGQLSPFDTSNPGVFTVVGAPEADGDVTLTFEASADLGSTSENVAVDLNGSSIGTLFITGTTDCAVPAAMAQIVVSESDWNTAIANGGGDVTITMSGSSTVTPGVCGSGFIRVQADYMGQATSQDVSPANGIPDECDSTVDCPGDINTTGTTNGMPDGITNLSDLQFFLTAYQSDLGNTPGSIADINTTGTTNGMPDGIVNLSDLQFYLTNWQAGLALCP